MPKHSGTEANHATVSEVELKLAHVFQHLLQDRFFSVFATLGDGDDSQRDASERCSDDREAVAKRTLGELALEQSFVEPLVKFLDNNLGKPVPPKFTPAYMLLLSGLFEKWDAEAQKQPGGGMPDIRRFLELAVQDPWAHGSKHYFHRGNLQLQLEVLTFTGVITFTGAITFIV